MKVVSSGLYPCMKLSSMNLDNRIEREGNDVSNPPTPPEPNLDNRIESESLLLLLLSLDSNESR